MGIDVRQNARELAELVKTLDGKVFWAADERD
jgi:hypothetical protein